MSDLSAPLTVVAVSVVVIGLVALAGYAHVKDLEDCFGSRWGAMSITGHAIFTLLADGESRTIDTIMAHLGLGAEHHVDVSVAIQYLCGTHKVNRQKVGGQWVYWREVQVAA